MSHRIRRKSRGEHHAPRRATGMRATTGLSWFAWIWLGGIYSAVVIGIAFLGATARPYRLSDNRYNGPTIILTSDGVLLAKLYDEYRVPVTIDQLPSYTVHAVLAAEDIRFFSHRGLDERGILRALWYDVRKGRLDQGGSTITQQLARYELLDPQRSLLRKSHEAVLAVRIERTYTKQEILERYLNAIYFGNGAYGIGAAAQRYFGKSVTALTPAESALLAGLIRAPGEGDPRRNIAIARRRQRAVLATMRQQRWLSQAEYQQAVREPIHLHAYSSTPWTAPYVVDAVRRELIARYGRDVVYHGGMTVVTSIDSHLQRAAESALRHALAAGKRQRVGNGALIAIEAPTGYIRAMVGGKSFWDSQFNRATQAHRQPGSAFKVFVYQAALDSGRLLTDTEIDAPIRVDNWQPKNYNNRYHGLVTLDTALANSLNSVAVRLVVELSPNAVIRAAQAAGITSQLTPSMAIALGASEVTPLEMARAFATYANGGMAAQPCLIKRISFKGRLLFQYTPVVRQQISMDTAFLLTQGLRAVISSGTGRRAQIGRPAAGKTGTSSQYRDAWFVGYTPELSTAVWLGNDNRRPMAGVTGGSLPAQAWAEFMRSATSHTPPSDFLQPPGIEAVRVCTISGKLALPTCPTTREEYVTRSRMPQEYCDVHFWVTKAVCAETGELPNSSCPRIVRRAFPFYAVPTDRCPINHLQTSDQTAPDLPVPSTKVPQKPSVGQLPVPHTAPPTIAPTTMLPSLAR